jgi:hypothetical protein
MSTKDLIEAIVNGDVLVVEQAFHTIMADKISTRIAEARIEYSRKIFRAEVDEQEKYKKFKPIGPEPIKWQAQQQGPAEEYSESAVDDMISEVLSKDADAGKWIEDFIKSDNPKFAGKSKAKRKQMALAAYYAKQKQN